MDATAFQAHVLGLFQTQSFTDSLVEIRHGGESTIIKVRKAHGIVIGLTRPFPCPRNVV